MIQTAENMALKYGIGRAEVGAFAATSFARAVAAQLAGWFDGEIVPVTNESFELAGYKARGIKLSAKATLAERDTHPRPTPVEVLAKLRSVFKDGVQTGGNVKGRRHRARPPARSHRCAAGNHGRAPTEGDRCALKCCIGLCGRRPGHNAVD